MKKEVLCIDLRKQPLHKAIEVLTALLEARRILEKDGLKLVATKKSATKNQLDLCT